MRYATPNILEILKTKVKLHLKEGESPNSILFIYQRTFLDQAIYRRKIDLLSTRQNDQKEGESLIQFLLSISPRFWIRLFKDQRSTSSQHVKMKGQSKQSKGLVKTEKALGCNNLKGQTIQSFFSHVARKIQLQGSSYNLVIMDSLQRFLRHVYPKLIKWFGLQYTDCFDLSRIGGRGLP